MRIFDRLGRGWRLGIQSLEIIGDHPKLLLFPVISALSLFAIVASFGGAIVGLAVNNQDVFESMNLYLEQYGEVVGYSLLFIFYLINYFVIVFFNVALVHNVRRIFAGEEASIAEGLAFSAQRSHHIFAWAALAATVGLVIKIAENRIGGLVAGILGFAWSLATYFVVPSLAASDIGPVEALKRSAATIREQWGDAIGAGFSLGLFTLLGSAIALGVGFILGGMVHPGLGLAMGVGIFFLTIIINAAAKNIFLAAAYDHTHGQTPEAFDAETLDGVFIQKR